jgi:shikimate dehydrogenase
MHNAAFAALGLADWRYELWETAPEDLGRRVAALRTDPGIAGANVTIPHKQAVVAHLDGVSAHAVSIGAVNTLFRDGGRLLGENTDWIGFLDDLRRHGLGNLAGARALVLGAGGSARAICYALVRAGAPRVVNRDPARAESLAASLPGVRALPALDQAQALGIDLIVNCTSAGMEPRETTTPWPSDLPFPAQAAVYDLVYKPATTRLMRDAFSAGLRVIGGIGMLAEQGAEAFSLWTGRDAREASVIMRQTLGAPPV